MLLRSQSNLFGKPTNFAPKPKPIFNPLVSSLPLDLSAAMDEMDEKVLGQDLAKFLKEYYSDQISSILLSPDSRLHYPLHVE